MNQRVFFGCSILFSIIFLFSCAPPQEEKELTQDELIAKGKYNVTLGGCNDCHTPKVFGPEGMMPDTTRLLSGHPEGFPIHEVDLNMVGPGKWMLMNDHLTAWVGPWGMSFSANLTPDKATGLGAVSEEMFIQSMREGKIKGVGRPILPPMPWQDMATLTTEDLKAIYAYLQSIPAINNSIPEPVAPNKVAELYGKK